MAGQPDLEEPGEKTPAEMLAPAPVLGLGAYLVGLGIHLLIPVAVLPRPVNYAVGGAIVLLGLGVLLSGLRAMRRVGKAPPHEDEPPTVITGGPFQYTRNPLYLGVCTVYVGLTALLNSPWPLLTLVPLAWYFDRVARREEAYLEAAFGDEFREYRDEVRRWL